MKTRISSGQKLFNGFNIVIMSILGVLCLIPFYYVLCLSLSSSVAVSAGEVTLWPVGFTLKSYEYILRKAQFLASFFNSIKRLALGVPINMLFTIITAYPLTRSSQAFPLRKIFVWFFLVTMLFGGGLIPWYMVISKTGLIDSVWALVLPGAVQVFSIIILMNFIKELPRELEESAFIDGAGHWVTLWLIYVPLSIPALATLALFSTVFHWNSWFDGLILMNKTIHYPLQSYLQTILAQRDLTRMMSAEDFKYFNEISDRTSKSAQIFIGALPILAVYPFLQRYFITGIVLGSVKG